MQTSVCLPTGHKMDTEISILYYNDKCRICLKEQDKYESKLDSLWNNNQTYRDLLIYLLYFKDNEQKGDEASSGIYSSVNLSSNLCGFCEEGLVQAYLFKKLCLESEKFLLNPEIIEFNTFKTEELSGNDEALEMEDPIIIEAAEKYENSIELPAVSSKKKFKKRKVRIKKEKACKVKTKKSYDCEECGKSYKQACGLSVHKRVHAGDSRYTCEFCGQKFIQWSSRRWHIRSRHTKEVNYECEICGRKFAHISAMHVHVRTHTGERPYICAYCPKKFQSSYGLTRHLLVHTGEKSALCEICSKKFSTLKSLKIHLRTHTNEKMYMCSVCDKPYRHLHPMRSHIEKKHPNVVPPPAHTILIGKKFEVIYKDSNNTNEIID